MVEATEAQGAQEQEVKIDDVTKEQMVAVSGSVLAVCIAAVWSLWGWQCAAISLWLAITLDEYIRLALRRKP